jgi:hypothetical protein
VCIVWLMAIGLTLGGTGILAFRSHEWRAARHTELGWMSQQWLAQFRAAGR